LRDPSIKAFFVVNPGNPDSRAIRPEMLHRLHDLVRDERSDLIIVADTVYATFVDGFRGIMAELPRNVICLHSFSKNYGATGNRLGFVAVATDNVMDDLLREQSPSLQAHAAERYRSLARDGEHLRFVDRLVADTRDVALHNIAGLATPDQVQMALFALSSLLPSGAPYVNATRAELAARERALLEPLGVSAPGGQDSNYYCLIDILEVATAQRGDAFAQRFEAEVDPAEFALRLAHDHGVVVLPGRIFDAQSWDVRVSLASLTVAELAAVSAAVLDLIESHPSG
jgi:aspartate 4-decarboxylase